MDDDKPNESETLSTAPTSTADVQLKEHGSGDDIEKNSSTSSADQDIPAGGHQCGCFAVGRWHGVAYSVLAGSQI